MKELLWMSLPLKLPTIWTRCSKQTLESTLTQCSSFLTSFRSPTKKTRKSLRSLSSKRPNSSMLKNSSFWSLTRTTKMPTFRVLSRSFSLLRQSSRVSWPSRNSTAYFPNKIGTRDRELQRQSETTRDAFSTLKILIERVSIWQPMQAKAS